MRRFLVPPFPADLSQVTLDRANSHHLLNVLRIRRGETVLLFTDGSWEVEARLVDVRDEHAVLDLVGSRSPRVHLQVVHLLLGVPKGPAMDQAVRMATEAGVREIHPMRCTRSVPKGDRSERWRKIAVSATQQCGRTDVPEIHSPRPFGDVLEQHRGFAHRLIALPQGKEITQIEGPVAVVIGPEGGFSTHETDLARELGFESSRLGPYILRTDTAAAVAVAKVLQLQ